MHLDTADTSSTDPIPGDLTDLRTALFLPAACYLVIASFGVYARRPAASAPRGG